MKTESDGSQVPTRRREANCSFCGNSDREVGPLVEGPREVYICRRCAEHCVSIHEAEQKRRTQAAGADPS